LLAKRIRCGGNRLELILQQLQRVAHAVAVGNLVSTGIDRANKTPSVARVGNEQYVDAALFELIEPRLDLGAQDPLGRAWSGPGMETTEEK
jgi:hypothetical protein